MHTLFPYQKRMILTECHPTLHTQNAPRLTNSPPLPFPPWIYSPNLGFSPWRLRACSSSKSRALSNCCKMKGKTYIIIDQTTYLSEVSFPTTYNSEGYCFWTSSHNTNIKSCVGAFKRTTCHQYIKHPVKITGLTFTGS